MKKHTKGNSKERAVIVTTAHRGVFYGDGYGDGYGSGEDIVRREVP